MSTANLGLAQPNFNVTGWHDPVNRNFDKIDQAFSVLGYPAVDAVWENNTEYHVEDRLLDDTDGTLWRCLVDHTSAASGSFEADRGTNPSYWVQMRSGFYWRGGWVTDRAYRLQDAATYDGQSYITTVAHTSGVFATDLANGYWELFAERGGSGLGTGDVSGPASAVGNNVVAFDGSTGKLVLDSGIPMGDIARKNDTVLTGNPTAPTQSPGNNSTRIATTAFVTAAVSAAVSSILGGVSAAFDTLSEIAAALGTKLSQSADLSDVNNAATSFNNIKQSASTSYAGVAEIATAAEYFAGTDTGRVLGVKETTDAGAPVALGNWTGNVSLDGSTFHNASAILTGNTTLNAFSNMKSGKAGFIDLTFSGGPWTISLNTGANYESAGGAGITLGTGKNRLGYYYDGSKLWVYVAARSLA